MNNLIRFRSRVVSFVLLLLLLGSVAPAADAQQPLVDSHPLRLTIQEGATVAFDGDQEVEFIVKITNGNFDVVSTQSSVSLEYTSIVAPGKRRALTAELEAPLPDGVALHAAVFINRVNRGHPGTPAAEPVALDTSPRTLVADIGTVERANALVSYNIELDKAGNIDAVGDLVANVVYTLTAAE